MSGAEIGMALQTLEWLATSIPKWIATSRAAGELTAEQEAQYQARQSAVFRAPSAQPAATATDVEPPPRAAA